MKKRRIFAALGVLLAGAAAYYIHEEPAAGMYLCPSCYGFEKIAEKTYVDREMSASGRQTLNANMEAARDRVLAFWESHERQPFVFVCGTDECDTRMHYRGGKAKAFGDSFILVYSQGRSAMFLAHEFSHIELFNRVGTRRAVFDGVPAWFERRVGRDRLAGHPIIRNRYVRKTAMYHRAGRPPADGCVRVEPGDGRSRTGHLWNGGVCSNPLDGFEWRSAGRSRSNRTCCERRYRCFLGPAGRDLRLKKPQYLRSTIEFGSF